MQEQDIKTDESPENYKGVDLFCEDNKSFAKGGVRHMIFQHGPELIKEGAIVKYGDRVIINERIWFGLLQDGFFSRARSGGACGC